MYLLVLAIVTPDQHLLTNLILLILIVTILETFTLADYLEHGTNYHLLT